MMNNTVKKLQSYDERVKLDLGCGDLKPVGYIGIDIKRTQGVDIVASALYLPIRAESIDEVRCHHLIEHFIPSEATACIKEIHRVLKKEGKAYLKIDRDWSLKRLIKKDPTHKHRYSVGEVRSMVEMFSIKKVKQKVYFYDKKLKNKIFAELVK